MAAKHAAKNKDHDLQAKVASTKVIGGNNNEVKVWCQFHSSGVGVNTGTNRHS